MDTGLSYKPTAIDLFSGCGGMTLGLTQAGFNVVGSVEIDLLAVETYKANHKSVNVSHTDIRKVVPRQLKRKLKLRGGELDLLVACPPCQGFSEIRTLKGKRKVDDPNNDLLFAILPFVKEFKPKSIMIENVPALARDARAKRFLHILQVLGYDVNEECMRVVDAAAYGVPQRRKRMILLAGRLGKINFATPTTERCTVRKAIEDLPPAGTSGDPLHDLITEHSPEVMERIRKIPKNGGSRSALGKENQLKCHQKCNGFKDIYGRIAWDDVAPTITSGCTNPSKGRFLHPSDDRAITLREAASLQSFPKDYFFSLKRGKNAAALMIGNALPPEFIRNHALKIKEYLEQTRRLVRPLNF